MLERQLQHVSCPVLILQLSDANVQGDTLADALRDELPGLYLSAHAVNVVLDFQGVHFLSSAGFRPLLRLNKQVREKGGRLILCGLSEDVKEVFAITRLISTTRAAPATFELQADVPAAVAALYQAPLETQNGSTESSS